MNHHLHYPFSPAIHCDNWRRGTGTDAGKGQGLGSETREWSYRGTLSKLDLSTTAEAGFGNLNAGFGGAAATVGKDRTRGQRFEYRQFIPCLEAQTKRRMGGDLPPARSYRLSQRNGPQQGHRGVEVEEGREGRRDRTRLFAVALGLEGTARSGAKKLLTRPLLMLEETVEQSETKQGVKRRDKHRHASTQRQRSPAEVPRFCQRGDADLDKTVSHGLAMTQLGLEYPGNIVRAPSVILDTDRRAARVAFPYDVSDGPSRRRA